ncbi:transposase [Pseudomonas gingeri]|uniref:transposase n=1 Tax=Pseudomonas gingeri TaxID=117681 RepID=UPI0015A1A4D3|nr:transposase [Pseudomonas gingeri]NWE28753.1 transposase [Pseudomonas gingeri]NWE97190.1 transposase [Pseudomonas gingeri]
MRQRSSYPKPFKAQVVQECLQPGASISSVAFTHGIDAIWLATEPMDMRAGIETAPA